MLPILAEDTLKVGAVGLGVLTAFRFAGGAFGILVATCVGLFNQLVTQRRLVS